MSYWSMARRGLLLAGMLALSVGARAADEPGRVELGFVPLGVSHLSPTGDDESVTGIQVPASGSLFLTGERGLYLQWFVAEHLAVEPQLSYYGLFTDEDDFTSLNASLRLNYLVSGPDRPSLYLYGGGGLVYFDFDDGDSETNPTAGGGLGFRQPIRSAGSFRVEAGYERLFGDEGEDADVFKLSFGFALRF
jgi:hypothetical protein